MTASWTVNFIRSDILAELGMEVPTTLDEVEAVFEAYKAKYPSNDPPVLDNAVTDGNLLGVSSAVPRTKLLKGYKVLFPND